MSLATRCPHCNTIFKVVQDQLKVSEGWVRCGRCQEVFNALEGLFDMEREPPPQKVPPAAPSTFVATDSVDAFDRPEARSDNPPPASDTSDTALATPPAEAAMVEPPAPIPVPAPMPSWQDPAAPAGEPAFEPTAPMWSAPSPQPREPEAFAPPSSIWQGDIQPQEELQPPPQPDPSSSAPTRSPLVGDAIEVMDAPRGAVTSFELDLPPSAEAMAAAVSNVLQAPFEPAQIDHQALPVTDEADALDSRYLLPSDDRQDRRPRRRSRGPEFADAEFPTDAMSDGPEWTGFWPEPEEDIDPPPHPHAHEPELGLAADEPPAGAQLLSRLEPADADDTLSRSLVGLPDAGPTTIPSRFHEDYQPEQSLPPPSKRKGRPGTRGRSPQAGEEPEFIKQAERQAIWRHPAIRTVLVLVALTLTLLLTGQVAHQERDQVASRFPALAPWLERWCEMAHCTVQAPMQLEDLQVDNIELVRTSSQGEDTYRLTAIIRNRAAVPLTWPHLDLSLTDANGAVVVRRVFAVDSAMARTAPDNEATGSVPTEVPASSSTTLQWQLQAPDLQLAGYTAELFYP